MTGRITDDTWVSPATKADVAHAAITVVVGMNACLRIFLEIKSGSEISDSTLEDLRKSIDTLDKQFEKLTGWVDEVSK